MPRRPFHKHALWTAVLAVNLLLFLAGIISAPGDYRLVGISLFGVGGIGLLIWMLFFVRSVRREYGQTVQKTIPRIERFRREIQNLIRKGQWTRDHSLGALEVWETEASAFVYKSLGEHVGSILVLCAGSMRNVPLSGGEARTIINAKLDYLLQLERDVTETMVSPDY